MKWSNQIVILALTVGCMLALSPRATASQTKAKPPKHVEPDWDDKIVPGSELTVLNLAQQMIPDIKEDPAKLGKMTATDLSGIRILDGVQQTFMEPDVDSDEAREIGNPDYFWMKDGASKCLVLVLKVDTEGVVIGLFKTTPKITLLDAVTTAQDMHVDVEMNKLWTIGPQRQAFSVQCWHDNSSESYDNYTFISVVNHKLRAIAGPLGFVSFKTYLTARKVLCKTSPSPTFRFTPSPGGAYFNFIVSEKTLKVCHRESAENWDWKTGIVFRRTVDHLWRWSPRHRGYRQVSRRRVK